MKHILYIKRDKPQLELHGR